MDLFPVFLDLDSRDCLVVGGGGVALRKVQGLVEEGARVTVVTTEAVEPLDVEGAVGRLVGPTAVVLDTQQIVGDVEAEICALGRGGVCRLLGVDHPGAHLED